MIWEVAVAVVEEQGAVEEAAELIGSGTVEALWARSSPDGERRVRLSKLRRH